MQIHTHTLLELPYTLTARERGLLVQCQHVNINSVQRDWVVFQRVIRPGQAWCRYDRASERLQECAVWGSWLAVKGCVLLWLETGLLGLMSAKLLCLATMEPVISLCGSLGSTGALGSPRSVIRQIVNRLHRAQPGMTEPPATSLGALWRGLTLSSLCLCPEFTGLFNHIILLKCPKETAAQQEPFRPMTTWRDLLYSSFFDYLQNKREFDIGSLLFFSLFLSCLLPTSSLKSPCYCWETSVRHCCWSFDMLQLGLRVSVQRSALSKTGEGWPLDLWVGHRDSKRSLPLMHALSQHLISRGG